MSNKANLLTSSMVNTNFISFMKLHEEYAKLNPLNVTFAKVYVKRILFLSICLYAYVSDVRLVYEYFCYSVVTNQGHM